MLELIAERFELALQFSDFVAQVGDLLLEAGDAGGAGGPNGLVVRRQRGRRRRRGLRIRSGRVRMLVIVGARRIGCRWLAGEQVHVARFLGTGLARQHGNQRRPALNEAIEGGVNILESVEVVEALGAAAKLSGSLRAAQQQNAEQSGFAAVEVEDLLQAVLILGDPVVGAGGGAGKAFFLQGGERLADSIFAEGGHRFAIVFLVAGIDQSMERKGIVSGSGDVLFDERAEHPGFDVSENEIQESSRREDCRERIVLHSCERRDAVC